jgi:hypothetical protein
MLFKNHMYVNYEYHKKGCHFGNLETRKLTCPHRYSWFYVIAFRFQTTVMLSTK